MYQGKYSHNNSAVYHRPRHRRRRRLNPRFVLLVSIVALLVGMVGGTLAYLVTSTTPVTNTFQPGKVPITVEESFTPNTTNKNDVTVQNNGNVDAYIRARVVFTWQDQDGNVSGKPVTSDDYSCVYNTKDWVKIDDYWYYRGRVSPNGGQTTSLFTSCTEERENAPSGYRLCVQVLAESIQADGGNGTMSAMELAWGVEPSKLA